MCFFRDLLGRSFWETLLAGKGADLPGQPDPSTYSPLQYARRQTNMVGGKGARAWSCCLSSDTSRKHQEGGRGMNGQKQYGNVAWGKKDAGRKAEAQLE